jgi:Protein of unknown function (DUF4235)
MKFLYKPIALISSIIARRLGRSAFRSLWAKLDDAPPPRPGSGEASVIKVVGAEALQAGVMAAVAAAVDRAFARAFHHLVGTWPDEPAGEEKK